jgi:prolyl-tRNA editing enzyme YbaK/EbsC (Cys-tRNA(Pro) deacylase)
MKKSVPMKPDTETNTTLDRLRVALDAVGVRRRLLPVADSTASPNDLAATLHIAANDIVLPVILEADGDYLAVLSSGSARLSLGQVSEIIGAKRVRTPGPRSVRKWLSKFIGMPDSPQESPALTWWEVPFITGLPTIVDRSLLSREFVYAPVGDSGWIMRIGPDEMRRATSAVVGDVTGRNRPRRA